MECFPQIIQDMSPKPSVPQIVHLADPELHLPKVKPLEEQELDPPICSLPMIFIFHHSPEFSVLNLHPPQPPEADCEDIVNFPQHLKFLREFPDINLDHVDLLRNVCHQFVENNNISLNVDMKSFVTIKVSDDDLTQTSPVPLQIDSFLLPANL